MKNRNGLIYFFVIVVSITVYLVIHLYCNGLKNDIYKENSEYQNSVNKQPINNIFTIKKEEPIDDEIKSLSFSQKNISIKKGSSLKLIVHVNPVELSSTKFTWKSSDPSVISVDKYGNIKGLKEGTAIITVTSPNGKTASIKVKVEANEIKAKNLVVNEKNISLNVGGLSQITVKIEPANATNRELIWESSNPNIATVDDNGIIKGISPGTAIIMVKTKDGSLEKQIVVTIKETEVESLSFAQNDISIKKDDTLRLIVQIKPIGLDSPKLTWSSSDPSVVSVDENGNIKGLKEGTATITVTSSNGKSASIKVSVVTDEVKVEKITLNPSKLTLDVGSSSQVTAIIGPANATNRELVWESSNPNIATVDDNGIVKGISPGTAIITVKTKDGTVESQIVVTIKETEVESLCFAQNDISIKKDDTLKLIVQIKPTGLDSPKLTWSSSDPSVVSVDENGNIKGLKEGTATITVTSPNGKTASIKVTVVTDEVKVEEITLNPNKLTLDVGSSSQVTAIIEPANATNRELVWESSNPNIATVDSNGVVTGISPGTAIITVKTKDGTVESQIVVTIKPVVTPTPRPPSDEIVFEYDSEDGNYIDLVNQFPIKDEVGKSLQGEKHTQDFKLRFNDKAVGVRYVITAEKLPGSDLANEWTKLFLVNDGEDVLNCYRTNNRVKSFDEYDTYNSNPNEVILYEGVISSSEATRGYKNFTFRMWVSEDMNLVNSNYLSENKTFKTRINVYAFEE